MVTYFSRSGNTGVIAGQIHRARGAAPFEIEAAKAYPEDYFETVEQARKERDNGYGPPLKTRLPGWPISARCFGVSYLGRDGASGHPVVSLHVRSIGKDRDPVHHAWRLRPRK